MPNHHAVYDRRPTDSVWQRAMTAAHWRVHRAAAKHLEPLLNQLAPAGFIRAYADYKRDWSRANAAAIAKGLPPGVTLPERVYQIKNGVVVDQFEQRDTRFLRGLLRVIFRIHERRDSIDAQELGQICGNPPREHDAKERTLESCKESKGNPEGAMWLTMIAELHKEDTRKIIESLTKRQRLMFDLYFCGTPDLPANLAHLINSPLTCEEIAKLLRIKKSAVARVLVRIRQKFRDKKLPDPLPIRNRYNPDLESQPARRPAKAKPVKPIEPEDIRDQIIDALYNQAVADLEELKKAKRLRKWAEVQARNIAQSRIILRVHFPAHLEDF